MPKNILQCLLYLLAAQHIWCVVAIIVQSCAGYYIVMAVK